MWLRDYRLTIYFLAIVLWDPPVGTFDSWLVAPSRVWAGAHEHCLVRAFYVDSEAHDSKYINYIYIKLNVGYFFKLTVLGYFYFVSKLFIYDMIESSNFFQLTVFN